MKQKHSNETIDSIEVEALRELIQTEGSHESLESISPSEALKKYLDTKASEYRQTTLESHECRLSHFVSWCEDNEIDDMNDLGGIDINDYRNWRRNDGDLNTVSEKTQQDTLRVFISFCEKIDAVPSNLSEKVVSPSLDDDEGSRDEMVSHEQAREVLNYLEKYEYASLEHVVWLLLSKTGMRSGGVRALDVDDYKPDVDNPYLDVNHRPEEGTAIKNGTAGERCVALSNSICEVIDDYLDDQRPDVTDEFDREPLLATQYGRVGRSTIRKYIYKWTRPCAISGECPHGKNLDDCEAASKADAASKCDSSCSPHPIRRGYITHKLKAGVPMAAVSERCNVTEEVIKEHYDERDEEERMRQRKEIFNEIYEDKDRFGARVTGGVDS